MSAGDGLLLVDKPTGWTSHDVVARVRRLARTRRVGHAGTLDPMATGVLVLGVGRGTKLLTFLVGADKEYAATVRLGLATHTDDADGEPTSTAAPGAVAAVTDQRIEQALAGLTGRIEQVPSAVSAIKVDGKRAYARVRAGDEVHLAARPVTVHRLDVVDRRRAVTDDGADVLDLDIVVHVSSGTYVRALGRDLGERLGVGGHLTALRRTRVGGFGSADCHTLTELAELTEPVKPAAPTEAGGHSGPVLPSPAGDPVETTRNAQPSGRAAGGAEPPGIPLITLARAARVFLPVRTVDARQARALGYGQGLESAEPGRTGPVAAIGPDGELVAILDESGPRARTHVVFPAPPGE